MDAVAVTQAPGLIGALLIGVSTAKALAAAERKPLIAVDHLHGHVAANFLEPDPLEPPFLCLIASGGHTLLAGVRSYGKPQGGPGGEAEEPPYDVLGQTLDDAAGEAFDKGARLLGLEYPGGPAIQRAAEGGDPDAFEFPVAMTRDPGLDFSFSGLKTALVYKVRELGPDRTREALADLAASYQRAIVSQLVAKLERALDAGEWKAIALGGGVAANSELRDRAGALAAERGPRPEARPDRALHRQRGDDRLRRSIPRPDPLSRLPGLRCVRRKYGCTRGLTATSATRRARSSRRFVPRARRSSSRRSTSTATIELLKAYLERIPVIELDGSVISELGLDADGRARLDTLSR